MEHNDFVISEEQMAYQSSCIERARELLLGRTGGRTPRAWVDTYGCQQNESDSEKIRGMLAQIGCDLIPGPDQADVIVINTCAIREHANSAHTGNIGALVHGKRPIRNR